MMINDNINGIFIVLFEKNNTLPVMTILILECTFLAIFPQVPVP